MDIAVRQYEPLASVEPRGVIKLPTLRILVHPHENRDIEPIEPGSIFADRCLRQALDISLVGLITPIWVLLFASPPQQFERMLALQLLESLALVRPAADGGIG